MHAYYANPLQGPQDLEFLFGLPLIASPATSCTACLPTAALAVAFEERIAECQVPHCPTARYQLAICK